MAGPITKKITIDVCCVPENPIYLRWVNSHGMLEHYCFGINQIYKLTTKDGPRIRLNFTDYSEQKALTQILSRESVESIVLQDYDLDTQTIVGLKSLLKSNSVEMLTEYVDSSDMTWQKVKVKPGTYEIHQSKLEVFNFQCEIELAETLIQNY